MPGSYLRLLSLDGDADGLRGLSSLMILEQLMEAVNPEMPPKPCDYFDMIGGTSTGGLLAVMLGRLKMGVNECIPAYLSLSERVFRKTSKTERWARFKRKVQVRSSSQELTQAVREIVKQQGLPEDALLKDASDAGCKVFVCATSKKPSETVVITSYRTPRSNSDLLDSVTIWEACRATFAVTSLFDPITVGGFGEEFADGATGAHNPVREMWDQAKMAWGPESLEGKIKCLVSIGTGVPSLKPFKDDVLHIGETLVAIAMEKEQTAERFQREQPLLDDPGRYSRFNVMRGLENIELGSGNVRAMAAATRRYLRSQEVHKQIRACTSTYRPLSLGNYEIRLLTIHPSNDDTSPLSSSLDHVPLSDAPQFAALSYCWGDLSNQVSITMNGLSFGVTVNLHSALQRLRREGVERVWVDAICINQNDFEEKSHQIRRMGAIYQEANQVAVWLGDAQDIAEGDINSLSAEYTAIADQVQSNPARRAFYQLLSKPYWTRVWIIQELAAASKITVFCGHNTVLWETLQKFSYLSSTADTERVGSEELRLRFQNLLQFRNDRLDTKPVSLLDAIYRSRYALSTDPKDKIYGLLGLVHDGRAFIPEPNYRQSLADTYTNFSKALIKKGFPLDLIYLRTSHRRVTELLPSWVVDWNDLNDALAKQELEHIQASIERSQSMFRQNEMNQSSFSGSALVVRGTILGRIDGMGSAYSADENDTIADVVHPVKGACSVPLGFDPSTYVFNALLGTQTSSAETSESPTNPIKLWSSDNSTIPESWIRDTISSNELEVFSKWIDANRLFITFGKTLDFWNSMWTSLSMDTAQETSQGTYLRSLFRTVLSGMRIATLETGEFGWVHPQSQRGDKLGRVFGCDRYVVLRSVAEGFHLIGEASLCRSADELGATDRVQDLVIF